MRLVYFLVIKNSWQLQLDSWLMSVEATLIKITADTNNFSRRTVLPPRFHLSAYKPKNTQSRKKTWKIFHASKETNLPSRYPSLFLGLFLVLKKCLPLRCFIHWGPFHYLLAEWQHYPCSAWSGTQLIKFRWLLAEPKHGSSYPLHCCSHLASSLGNSK